jgi:hypothetical protein
MFLTGVALAQSGTTYCPDVDTMNCVTTGMFQETTCCIDADGGGMKQWTCSQEIFDCIGDGDEVIYGVPGPAFDCHDPGAQCN